jgi:hypothetical protein
MMFFMYMPLIVIMETLLLVFWVSLFIQQWPELAEEFEAMGEQDSTLGCFVESSGLVLKGAVASQMNSVATE